MTKALIIVDVQNDFIEGGSLAVTGGQNVAENIENYLSNHNYETVVATQDWHIEPGTHWATDEDPNYVTTWPIHCGAETAGAELHPALQAALAKQTNVKYVRKGQYEAAYSGFEGFEAESGLTLDEILRKAGVDEVDVIGLATDHCVRATAQDALDNEYKVNIFTSLVAGVDKTASELALTNLEMNGATLV